MKENIQNIVKMYLDHYPEERDKLAKLLLLIEDYHDNISFIFNRKNFQGHITASGFIYCVSEDKLLMLEHKTYSLFLQPGGHVESADSDIISAAKREIFEETGLYDLELVQITDDINVPFDINTHFIPRNDKKMEDEHYHHDFGYLFIVQQLDDIKIDYNESNSYKWVDLSVVEKNERFIEVIKKIRKFLDTSK